MTVVETLVAGRYRIGPCLGAGGMGRVWLARDELLQRDVAIKEIALPFGLAEEEREEMRARTLREARAAARLNHPNVVRTYDVQPGDARPWIVMEYVPSRSLLQVIKENGPLPTEQVAGIGLAVLSALDAAFRAGVMHRDIKPSNVLIADDGRVLLTDFGSAIVDENEGALTQTGIVLGSPRYIAPERAANGVSTLEADLWSLGATLYEAVEGRPPYTRDTTIAMLVALATEKPDRLDRAGALRPVINGLLQKNPKARMRLPEAEQRLRRIADVENGVRLHHVPAQRAGEPMAGAAPIALGRRVPVTLDGTVVRAESSPVLPAVSAPPAAQAATVYASSPETVPASSPARHVPPPAVPARRLWQRPRFALWVTGGAAALVMAAGTTAYALRDGSPAPTGGGDRLAAAGATSEPSSPAASSPAARPTVLPAGYKWYKSRSGFQVAWPAKWAKVGESRSSVTLCAPGGPPVVAVREWGRSDPDLFVAMRREETAAALPGYRRVRMVVSPQQDRAEWEYTFTDPTFGRLHGLERAVILSGRAYLLQWRTPAGKWADNRKRMGIVLDTFRPASAPAVSATNAPPAGFTAYRNTSGFQVFAPAKWGKIDETPTSVVFCAPGGPPLVGVRAWAPSNVDLRLALAREEELSGLQQYRRIALETVPGERGAVWEYTFTDPKMGRLHGLERAFLTPTGAYLLQWRTPAGEWAVNLPKLGVVAGSFSA